MRARLAVFLGLVVIAIAGCGDDEDDDTTGAATTTDAAAAEVDALQEEIANLSDEEQIERVGEAWAEPFAGQDEGMCAYLHPDLGGASSCTTYVQGELIGSIGRQRSFAGATVESVDVKGQTAVAEFDNGEQIDFEQDPEGEWKVSGVPGPRG
jgi:hypothetical protein